MEEAATQLKDIDFSDWLNEHLCELDLTHDLAEEKSVGEWTEIRLFLSSTFIDTQAERDEIIKSIIPEINRKMAPNFIRIIPVDLRWGVLAEECKSCFDIQKTCLNQIDNCRMSGKQSPWFLGLRTSRYGWLQNEVMSSQGFETPQHYDWIDQLSGTEKAVSITSLEVCHASRVPETLSPYPTVFFYHRQFTPAAQEKLRGDELRWVFEFEYTAEEVLDPELKHQYTLIDKAGAYAKDKDELDDFLKAQSHMIYSDYSADYKQAYYTNKRENAKSFGVGYTCNLDEFAQKVERDLLTAIKMNFIVPDSSKLDGYLFDTIQHENAIKLKASTFVGRTEMAEETFEHTRSIEGEHTLILHGEPGCGKSGLLAAVAQRTIDCKGKDDFVLVHAVDSCPGSNLLEKFLRRLHVNLRTFRRDRGEINISCDPPESITDLRQEHQSFIIDTAQRYPESRFVIIVDAVNQFHNSLGAWEMWWLVRDEGAPNLRFIISTLTEENNTYKNAMISCKHSRSLEVSQMSKEDLIDMVNRTLERYNKKLTNYDDRLLGNQMEVLLSKSSSPLFLIAACEALRKFGIFEKVSEYISSFPDKITGLFSFLVDEWSGEYGKEFTEDVCGLIGLSKDGLLENQINDLLRFKEEMVQGEKGGFLYDSSFSRIYDSVSSFLAAGGGGYLRFFHDQLKYTIRDKFLDDTFSQNTHQWFCDFFMSIIQPQLCSLPLAKTPDYYEHVLNQIVHHQLEVARVTQSFETFNHTLRNIYFVRERILFDQHNNLNNEYLTAIEAAPNPLDKSAFKLWAKFVQLYAPAIKEFPQFAYNMATNQAPSSVVSRDTLLLTGPEPQVGYPLSWANIPAADDPISVKIPSAGVDCVASSVAKDVVVIAAQSHAGIYDLSSGETLHKLPVRAYSVHLAAGEETLFVGDEGGIVHSYDVDSGAHKCSSEAGEDCITWLGTDRAGLVIAGPGYARKAICWDDHSSVGEYMVLDPEDLSLVRSWGCEDPSYHHSYNTATHKLISSHKGFLAVWDPDSGEKLFTGSDESRCIYCVDSHLTKNLVISGNNELQVVEWEISDQGLQILRKVELPCLSAVSGWPYGGVWSVKYSVDGDLIYCTEPQSQSIKIYNKESEKVGELKGHSACVNKISTVPGASGEILSSDRDSVSFLWSLPSSGDVDACKQELDEKVQWVGFSVGEELFATVTDTHCRLWDSQDLKVVRSVEFGGFYRSKGEFHPDGKCLFLNSRMGVLVYDLQLQLLESYQGMSLVVVYKMFHCV